MRFRARMEQRSMATLVAVTLCLEKLCKECVVHLSENGLEFRKPIDESSEVQMFASLSRDIFTDFNIASLANNEISLLLDVKILLKGFRSASKGEQVNMRLAMRDEIPCLSLITDEPNGLAVTQDVPILRLISREAMIDYAHPEYPGPSITVEFPNPTDVRTVLDHLKALNKFMTISLNKNGELTFAVTTESASIRTAYKSQVCGTPNFDGKKKAVAVNVGDFLSVMNFGNAPYEEATISVIEASVVVISASFDQGMSRMVYICPTVDPQDLAEW